MLPSCSQSHYSRFAATFGHNPPEQSDDFESRRVTECTTLVMSKALSPYLPETINQLRIKAEPLVIIDAVAISRYTGQLDNRTICVRSAPLSQTLSRGFHLIGTVAIVLILTAVLTLELLPNYDNVGLT
jgi:hypothetical protein